MASDNVIVLGVFSCGCRFDATLSHLEAVNCSPSESDLVMERMKEHSAGRQCHPSSAAVVVSVEAVMFRHHGMEVTWFPNYAEYAKAWYATHSEDVAPVVRISNLKEGIHGKL